MKDGIINTTIANGVESFAFALLVAKAPIFKIWPLDWIAKYIIDQISQPLFDEAQRHANYKKDRDDAEKEALEAKAESEYLQKLQDEGKTLEDPTTKAAYEKWKKEQRDLIRFGGPAARP